MKILVRDIPPHGLQIDQQIDPAGLDLVDNDIQCKSTVNLKAKVERLGETVLARGQAKATFQILCARCLVSVDQEINQPFDLDYPVDKRTNSIDLGDDVRQEIILALPTVVLCKNDCKGLCAGCKVNLNEETCKCRKVSES